MSSDVSNRTEFPKEWFRERPRADILPEYAEAPSSLRYDLDVANQEDIPAALRQLAVEIEKQQGIETTDTPVKEIQAREKTKSTSENRLSGKRVTRMVATYAILQAGFSVGGAILHTDPGEANPITNNVVLEGPQNAANIWNKGVEIGHGAVNVAAQVKKIAGIIG